MSEYDGTSQLNMRVDRNLHELVKRAAQRAGLSISEYVGKALREAVSADAKAKRFSVSGQTFEQEILRLSQQANEMTTKQGRR